MLRAATCAFMLLLSCAGYAYDPAEKTIVREGDMPLILTAPHGGDEALGWMAARRHGNTKSDEGLLDITERTARAIEKKSGHRPYLVIAKFHRKYLDANRPAKDAMESDEALPAYQYYHAQIARFVAEVRATYPEGALLLDLHGQSEDPLAIYRGTHDGRTVRALLARFGNDALQGENSITGALQRKGYAVNPAIEATNAIEYARWNGGYTVRTYGSHRADGIDAIQLEIGSRERRNAALPDDLADAILAFSGKYLAASAEKR